MIIASTVGNLAKVADPKIWAAQGGILALIILALFIMIALGSWGVARYLNKNNEIFSAAINKVVDASTEDRKEARQQFIDLNNNVIEAHREFSKSAEQAHLRSAKATEELTIAIRSNSGRN